MKTLYIISNGGDKLPDKEIIHLEQENRHPRVSLLEMALSADLIDERYLYGKAPKFRRWFYKRIPVALAQIIETLLVYRRYDVIFSHTEKAGLPLALLIKIFRIKKVHILVMSRITSMNEKKSRQKKWFLKHSHSHIDRILIWSSVQRNICIQEVGVPPSKIMLINRGTDQKFWKHPLSSHTDTICAVGMEMRDYPTLIEALKPLDIPCHIAASNFMRGIKFETVQNIHQVVDELPKYLTVGKKSYEELRDLYARSRFVVVPLLPTDSDNGLTSILEAMAMGKTVICSRVEGQVDIIQEGVTGVFVPQGDPQALREAIVSLWNDPERAEQMGKAARKYIEEHQTLEQFVQTITREAHKVVAHAAGSKNRDSIEASSVVEKVEG